MQHFLMWKLGWWILHILAIIMMLYLGHLMR
jgi:hypothetical protein